MNSGGSNISDPPPLCPICGAEMRSRTAYKGRNAGGQFWSCSTYPKCRGTAPKTTNTGPSNKTSAAQDTTNNPPAALSTLDVLRRERVTWRDAATDRDGWATRLVSAGGSLRVQPHPDAKMLATCWLARQTRPTPRLDSEQPAATSAAVGTMLKLLARGMAPPMHPTAETLLLEGNHTPTADTPKVGVVVPNRGPTVFADNMCGSPAEQHLVEVLEQHKPGAGRWLIPQAA